MNKSSLWTLVPSLVALVRRNKFPSSTIESVWFPKAVSLSTNSRSSESLDRVLTPKPGGRRVIFGVDEERGLVYSEYPPAPATIAMLKITNKML